MKYILLCLFTIFFSACSVKYSAQSYPQKQNSAEVEKINNLQMALLSLSSNINEHEANKIATVSVLYSLELANQYELVSPPLFHNTLINMNLKRRGFCHHFALDLIKKLKKQNLKTLDLRWAVHEKANYWEHNAVVISAKGANFQEGIVLDAWRNSGKLYWNYVNKDIKYQWSEALSDSKYYGTLR